jgi:hypothetical protein
MKTLLKIAVGAAFAGCLVNLLVKKRSERRAHGGAATDAPDPATLGTAEDGDSQRDWTPQESPA